MRNHLVVAIFRSMASLLEMKGENPYRVRAYRRAAQVIHDLTEDIETIAVQEKLKGLPGIGKDLAGKILEIIQTGTLAPYEQLKKDIPPVLLSFLSLPGLQPRTAHYLYEELGIRTLDDLERMVRSHMLRTLPGMNNKEAQDKILEAIQALKG